MRVAEFSNVRCKKANSPLHRTTAPSGPGSPHYRGFTITFRPLHTHTHTHTHPCHPAEFEPTTHNPRKLAAANPRLRRRAHWDRLPNQISVYISNHASKQEGEMQKIL